MKHSQKTRLQMAALMRRAKDFLAAAEGIEKSYFICNAVHNAATSNGSEDTLKTVKAVQRMICSRLKVPGQCYPDFEDWLRHALDMPEWPNNYLPVDKLQAHRHAWLDMLIEEFES